MATIPLSQALWSRFTSPGILWLGLGLCGTSCFTWGNISTLYIGVVPAVTDGSEENDLSVGKSVGKLSFRKSEPPPSGLI